MICRAAALFFLTSAHSASALSCLPPDVKRSFAEASEAEEVYYLVEGTLTPKGKMPQTNHDPDRLPADLTHVKADFDGIALGRDGRNAPLSREIGLEVACVGGWCGGVADGARVLAFLRETETGLRLFLGPCGGFAFVDPTPAQLRDARQCLDAGDCMPDQF